MISFDLTGKVAIVTGGSKGLGKDMAKSLAEAGADIAMIARGQQAMDEACDEIAQACGVRTKGYAADLADIDACKAAVDAILADFGAINVLVNNAALISSEDVDSLTPETFDRCMNANVRGPYFLSQYVVERYMKERGGNIINICSVMSYRATPTSPIYSITKAAEEMMTRCQATAWAKHGIFVNGIAPGNMMLGMGENMSDEYVAEVKAKTPQGRPGQAEDLGGACVYLASDACRFTQGQIIVVDGGLLLPLK